MFCTKCGRKIEAGNAFCSACGAKVDGEISNASQPEIEKSQDVALQPETLYVTPVNPVLTTLKSLAASPVFLIGIICMTLSVLFSVLPVTGTNNIVNNILFRLGIYNYVPYRAISLLNVILSASNIISLIPSTLILTGLWITYLSGINKQVVGIKTGGLTIIKVITIIQLIFYCIGIFLLEIILIIAALASSASFGNTPEISLALGIATILILLISVFCIIYYVKIISSINCAINSARKMAVVGHVSAFVAVINIIIALYSLLMLPFNMFSQGVLSIFGIGTSIVSIVQVLMFSVIMFMARSKMKKL